jgi:hypothetical protein
MLWIRVRYAKSMYPVCTYMSEAPEVPFYQHLRVLKSFPKGLGAVRRRKSCSIDAKNRIPKQVSDFFVFTYYKKIIP